MLSTVPSLRQVLAFECPVCGQILVPSEREDVYNFCEQCGYIIPAVVPEQPKTSDNDT